MDIFACKCPQKKILPILNTPSTANVIQYFISNKFILGWFASFRYYMHLTFLSKCVVYLYALIWLVSASMTNAKQFKTSILYGLIHID